MHLFARLFVFCVLSFFGFLFFVLFLWLLFLFFVQLRIPIFLARLFLEHEFSFAAFSRHLPPLPTTSRHYMSQNDPTRHGKTGLVWISVGRCFCLGALSLPSLPGKRKIITLACSRVFTLTSACACRAGRWLQYLRGGDGESLRPVR